MNIRPIHSDQRFSSRYRIKKRADYLRIKQRRRRIVSEHLVLYTHSNDLSTCRLGLIVPKSVGSAPIRNRVKRLIREAFRKLRSLFPGGWDIVALAKPSASTLTYVHVVDALTACWTWLQGKEHQR